MKRRPSKRRSRADDSGKWAVRPSSCTPTIGSASPIDCSHSRCASSICGRNSASCASAAAIRASMASSSACCSGVGAWTSGGVLPVFCPMPDSAMLLKYAKSR